MSDTEREKLADERTLTNAYEELQQLLREPCTPEDRMLARQLVFNLMTVEVRSAALRDTRSPSTDWIRDAAEEAANTLLDTIQKAADEHHEGELGYAYESMPLAADVEIIEAVVRKHYAAAAPQTADTPRDTSDTVDASEVQHE